MGFRPETVEIAYDKTVMRTGKRSWKYMDAIIENWSSKGLFTAEDIENEDNKARAETYQKQTAKTPSGDEGDRPDAENYKRMKRMLEKMKGKGEK